MENNRHLRTDARLWPDIRRGIRVTRKSLSGMEQASSRTEYASCNVTKVQRKVKSSESANSYKLQFCLISGFSLRTKRQLLFV